MKRNILQYLFWRFDDANSMLSKSRTIFWFVKSRYADSMNQALQLVSSDKLAEEICSTNGCQHAEI